MTPAYARAPCGERAIGYAPAHGRHVNLAFGLGLRGIVAPLVYTGTTTAVFVNAYVRQTLAPALREGEILVIDRHPAHHSGSMRPAIRAQGAHLWLLPPYSPDLSPAEFCGSKVKNTMRRHEPRTLQDILDAAGATLNTITPHDILGWFRHCGYV
jgi:transposase